MYTWNVPPPLQISKYATDHGQWRIYKLEQLLIFHVLILIKPTTFSRTGRGLCNSLSILFPKRESLVRLLRWYICMLRRFNCSYNVNNEWPCGRSSIGISCHFPGCSLNKRGWSWVCTVSRRDHVTVRVYSCHIMNTTTLVERAEKVLIKTKYFFIRYNLNE